MSTEMLESNAATSNIAIDAVEHALRLKFPRSYRRFLMETNGGRPAMNLFPIVGMRSNPFGNINFFFGIEVDSDVYDLRKTNLFYSIPEGIVLIAENGMGDYVSLDLRNGAERVAFWDHRHFWGTGEWREQDLYPVAPSFEVFLTMLRLATI